FVDEFIQAVKQRWPDVLLQFEDFAQKNAMPLLNPLYMGWRNPRITDDEYYEFVDEFIQAVKQRWPDVLLQFEDFAQKNAMPLL
ncbi:hypothetical protein CQA18_27405, partial [Enterobacter hormaechei]